VGKGSGKRAYSKKNRNTYWTNIVNKHNYYVEIVFDNLTEDEAFQCEKDTILEFKYFGYNLCNLTDGGEGLAGYTFSEEQRLKISNSLTGRKRPQNVVDKINKSNTGKKRTLAQLSNLSKCQLGNSNSSDKTEYLFYCDEDIFVGTRRDFEKYNNFPKSSINSLFKTKAVPTYRGWSVIIHK
jgi:hypothetical protein